MPHCNSPLGSRNKRITYACIMENFLTQTRQKTSLFFTRHLKLCASLYQKTGRAVFSIKPLDGVSKKLALVKRYGQDSEDLIPWLCGPSPKKSQTSPEVRGVCFQYDRLRCPSRQHINECFHPENVFLLSLSEAEKHLNSNKKFKVAKYNLIEYSNTFPSD